MNLAESADHVLRAELQRARAAGMEPGWSAGTIWRPPAGMPSAASNATTSALASKASTLLAPPFQ